MGASVAVTAVSPSAAAREVHLTAAGDCSASPDTDLVLNGIARRDRDAHLAVGDLAYGYSATPYQWRHYVEHCVGGGSHSSWSRGRESEDNNNGDVNDSSACLPNQVPGISAIYGQEYGLDFPTNAPSSGSSRSART